VEDLEETFANLRKVNIKLNPAKCAFGVPSGKLLGFLVSHRGIEANPDKVKAIEEMHLPWQSQGNAVPRGVHGGPGALQPEKQGEGIAFIATHEAYRQVRVDSRS
jgi:hypothetical protein